MPTAEVLDWLPIWGVYLVTVALIVIAIEVGFYVGVLRGRRPNREPEAPVDAMVGSTLGLLAFMLAFTFGMATTRFDARTDLVLQEAIAIRTADLRAQFLPEPARSQMRGMLREYVDVRIRAAREPAYALKAIARSEELQDVLWSRIGALGQAVPAVDVGGLAAALINVITTHEKRVTAALHNRLNGSIWGALFGLMVIAMGMVGYRSGLSGGRSIVATATLAFAFSAVVALVVDLDRPQQGLVRVSQQAMLDVQAKLSDGRPPSGD
jgi:hypothetical protein